MYDVIIIGGGVVGAFLARNLSRYNGKFLVIEKEGDVGMVTSMANSAIIHSGYDPLPGTNKAKFNVLGNKMFSQIAEELDVSFGQIGSLTIANSDEDILTLQSLQKRAKENGVEVELIDREELKKLEPNISDNSKGALLANSCGIIDPFNLVVHAFENACDNGVSLALNEEVLDIKYENDNYYITTNKRLLKSKVVINAAGLYADKIAKMIEDITWTINPRKGEYYLLDHYTTELVHHVIFPLPSSKGKGVLVSPTTSFNFIVGPSSESVENKDDVSTDSLTLSDIKMQANLNIKNIDYSQSIRVFAGMRATPSTHDFIIESSKKYNSFINVAGIESPGLVSSPAIGEYVIDNLVVPLLNLEINKNYNPYVKKYIHPLKMNEKFASDFIKEHPDYGKVVCSCEKVTLGEIKDCLSRSVPPRSIKAVKKRTRAGFGKCQGGFCHPLVLKILSEYFNLDMNEIMYQSQNSEIVKEKIKE
ncbi:MAG: NAD(P)/FAD-dependent oxidoreductase [Bacilli bacterium]